MDSTLRFKKTLTEDELRELCRPRLRLFLSVDVVGSTRLKQRTLGRASHRAWLPGLFGFFTSFPEELETIWHELAKSSGVQFRPPKPWKHLGDEIVFVADIESSSQLSLHIKAFSRALLDRNRRGRTGTETSAELRFKGAAWLAGFPVANIAIPLSDHPIEEYLGASIDTGFRLSRLSTPRMMAISVELAWAILRVSAMLGGAPFRYAGRRPLDGVQVDGGYPAIFVDTGASVLESDEDTLLGYGNVATEVLERFCKAFILDHGQPRHLPFIADDPALGSRPDGYDREVDDVEQFLRTLFHIEPPPSGPSGGGDGVDVGQQEEEIVRDLESLKISRADRGEQGN